MPLNDTELGSYDSNVLRLPADKRTAYHGQVDRLIAELSKTVRSKTKINITKVVKAGSFAKYTILRRTSADPVDVDVVFYVAGKSIESETFESLSATLHSLLIEIYPNKSVEDFEIQRKAATVHIRRVRPQRRHRAGDRGPAPWLWLAVQPRRFEDRDLRAVPDQVRPGPQGQGRGIPHAGAHGEEMAQPCRALPLKSFAIELIMAYILAKDGKSGSIEQRFRNFLLYIAQSGLKDKIRFPENVGFIPRFPSRS